MTTPWRSIRPGDDITIAVYKADRRRRFTVGTRCLSVSDELLVLHGLRGRPFETAAGVTSLATTTLEYFPWGRWWNIVSFFDPDTSLPLEHFCNILTPATYASAELRYVDLDLDLAVRAGGAPIVEDIAEFRHHARAWRYPAAVRKQAWAALREVRALAESHQPPFTTDPLPCAIARARGLRFSPSGMFQHEVAVRPRLPCPQEKTRHSP